MDMDYLYKDAKVVALRRPLRFARVSVGLLLPQGREAPPSVIMRASYPARAQGGLEPPCDV
jgi:hypothetical protein